MMKHKGQKHVEEGNSPAKVAQKRALAKTNEIYKMLEWIWIGSKEQ
jgi:hypothetical protein